MLDSIHLNNGSTLSENSFNATSEGHTALIVSNSSAIVNKKTDLSNRRYVLRWFMFSGLSSRGICKRSLQIEFKIPLKMRKCKDKIQLTILNLSLF